MWPQKQLHTQIKQFSLVLVIMSKMATFNVSVVLWSHSILTTHQRIQIRTTRRPPAKRDMILKIHCQPLLSHVGWSREHVWSTPDSGQGYCVQHLIVGDDIDPCGKKFSSMKWPLLLMILRDITDDRELIFIITGTFVRVHTEPRVIPPVYWAIFRILTQVVLVGN